jgi:type IV secretion system protein VirB1
MLLALTAFMAIAAQCGLAVHVDTLAAIAQAESSFHTGAVNDNTDRRRYHPRSRDEAVALATNLIASQGHSVDLGLMQINSANLAKLRMTIEDAFDPCKNVAAGARILAEAYRPEPAREKEQADLLQALSRYNTGHPTRGLRNGYVVRVQSAAEQVVPAIRLRSPALTVAQGGDAIAQPLSLPARWDVFAQARYVHQVGGKDLMRSMPQKSTDAASTSELRLPQSAQHSAFDQERSGKVP